jgi:Rv2993c-like, N-terminal
MRLCMFHPADRPMERGWVGRIDGDTVVHLAAQTLQSFFLGGGGAREHAEYPLAEVRLLAPVHYPPSVRVFESAESFEFANPAAVLPPGAEAPVSRDASSVEALVRPAAIIGAGESVGGFTILGELRADGVRPPKDRDFALYLGPVVVTPDEDDLVTLDHKAPFAWKDALALAAANTHLRAGDVIAALPVVRTELPRGAPFELSIDGIGALAGRLT